MNYYDYHKDIIFSNGGKTMKGRWLKILGVTTLALAGICISTGQTSESKAEIVIESTSAGGSHVEKSGGAVIDYSNTSSGYVNVKYTEKTNKTMKVQVIGPGGNTFTYTLYNTSYEVMPLTDGNGTYTVKVLKNISGSTYAQVASVSFKASLSDEFQPYIRPNQYVNYNASTKCVKKAESLCKKANDELAKVKKVYKWVIKTFKYDYNKAKTVKAGYVPKLDPLFKSKKGICFDYASTMSAMLRSQGVPVKLVIGYTGKEYHAWINVYSKKKGWITGAIYLAADQWKLMDPTFASTGKSSKTVMKYINNKKNYKAKYSY